MKKVIYQNLYKLLSALSERVNNRHINRYKIAVGTALLLLSSSCQTPKKNNNREEMKDSITSDSIKNTQETEVNMYCYDTVNIAETKIDTVETIVAPPILKSVDVDIPPKIIDLVTCYDMPVDVEPDCYIITVDDGTLQPDTIEDNKIYQVAEKMPAFPGGNSKLMEHIVNNIHYPTGYDLCVQGRVIIEAVIEKDGSISNAKVLRSLELTLDTIALNAIKKLPNFEPGIQNGKPVRVKYVIPISFR